MPSSFFALFDDIASLLDDVSAMTKVATQKTAGVLGDDLALNAQQVTGVAAARELPVVWAVARGSLVNKVILVPLALLISAFAPWAVTPLLMVGGAFLCYEGVEKLVHRLQHRGSGAAEHRQHLAALADPAADLVAFERARIKGAVRTDFVLSAEIIAITLGTVAGAPFGQQVAVLTGIALLMTVGVYGLVALIVKLDDLGLHLAESGAAAARALGRAILRAAPWLMKALSVAGTAAMFLVGGGILVHGVPALHHAIEALAAAAAAGPAGALGSALVPLLGNLAVGVIAGAVVLLVVSLVTRLRGRRGAAPASVK